MRSLIILALAGASLAAPFKYFGFFVPGDEDYNSYPTASGPISSIPTGSYPTGGQPPFDFYPTDTGITTSVTPSGTAGPPAPTDDVYSVLSKDRRGLMIDYKLAPRFEGHGVGSKPHHPGKPHYTGKPRDTGYPHYPFPTATSGFGWPKPTAPPK